MLFRDRPGGRHCSHAQKPSSYFSPFPLSSNFWSVGMEIGEPGLHEKLPMCDKGVEVDASIILTSLHDNIAHQ